jgi:site-specific DNA-methyltransferase (adenine-specific)
MVEGEKGRYQIAEKQWPGGLVLITDPPYGIDYKSGREGSLDRSIAGDENTDLRNSIFGICENMAVFGSWKCSPPIPPKGTLIWNKPILSMGDLSFPWSMNYELIWIYGKGWEGTRTGAVIEGETIPTWNTGPAKRSHPHQKPVEIFSQIIQKSTAQTILDPFMGSGTHVGILP